MKTVLKWAGYTLAALLAVGLIAVGFVYAASERTVRRAYDATQVAVSVPDDPAAVAEGRRLALTRGCYDGCHGKAVDGRVFFDRPMLARIVAPNLTKVVATHSDAELEGVIRQGIRQNGQSSIGMPAAMFHHLTDEDLGAIIAFLRSLPPTDGPLTEIRLGPLARVGVVLGKYEPQVAMIDRSARRLTAAELGDSIVLGRYLAFSSCTECHGHDLRGSQDGSTPPLAIAAIYSSDEFVRLMRTGTARGDRELRLMSEVARGRFAHFVDAEISALYAYLRTLSSAP